MAKVQSPQVLTANRLRTGDVAYWSRGEWAAALVSAEVFRDLAAADEALVRAKQSVADCVMVNAYLFALDLGDDGPRPIEEREIIRAAGPTVRPDTGKQAAPHV